MNDPPLTQAQGAGKTVNLGMMTTANKITILRILLVPFFIIQVLSYVEDGQEIHRLLALLCFAVAAISDGIDGYVARRYNQHSVLGAILDPLADKLLLVSGVVLLSIDHGIRFEKLPLWLAVTILSRDVLLLIGLAVIYYTVGKIDVHPHIIGKAATVLQMVTVLWVLLKWNPAPLKIWVWSAGLCTAVSGAIYVLEGMRQLATSPSSQAKSGGPH